MAVVFQWFMAYCLVRLQTYEKFLTVIANKMTKPPKSFTSDFELALIKAVKVVWPELRIYLCFFHFKQSVSRKIQELGLAGIYKSSPEVRKILKLPQILAFVPVSDLVGVNPVPKKTASRKPRNPKPVERLSPMFSVEHWSVYERILDQISRTNNFTEVWQNSFSSMLIKHPLVYSLVDSLRKEQKMVEDNIIRLNAGIEYKRKPKYVQLDEQLTFAVKSYNKNTFSHYYYTINSIVSY